MKKTPWWVWTIGAVVVVAAIAAAVFLAGTPAEGPGSAGPSSGEVPGTGATSSVEPTATLPDEDGSTQTPPEPGKPQTVRLYFVRGEKLGVVSRQVPPTKAVATAAAQQLLLGPTGVEKSWGFSSEVPVGTDLLGVSIKDGTATVDLSGEFASGGGTLSVSLRLAQVVFTLTQFSTVDRVMFQMDGKTVGVFTGEGVVLDGPQTRADYEDVVPALLVEGPTPGATVTSPVRIWGTGNTFEASFMVRIEDADGVTIVEKPGMATSGTGTRGTFDITVPYATAATGMGTIVVYESSAKDGSPVNVVEIPVKLQ